MMRVMAGSARPSGPTPCSSKVRRTGGRGSALIADRGADGGVGAAVDAAGRSGSRTGAIAASRSKRPMAATIPPASPSVARMNSAPTAVRRRRDHLAAVGVRRRTCGGARGVTTGADAARAEAGTGLSRFETAAAAALCRAGRVARCGPTVRPRFGRLRSCALAGSAAGGDVTDLATERRPGVDAGVVSIVTRPGARMASGTVCASAATDIGTG